MQKDEQKLVLAALPHSPGCYKFFGAQDQILYVGKAKNLKKRVSSYFHKTQSNYKTRKLVEQIEKVEFTVTPTEHDAFLLENSLIKHYQPKYNIDLKDDKSYPYIVFKNEDFPRVFLTRRVIKDGSEYIGPFTGVARVRELLELVRNNIPLRTCTLNLAPRNIAKGKYRVCLQYHLGNCKGPCEGLQSAEDYQQNLQQVKHILKGNLSEVLKYLKSEMTAFAGNLEFEKAAIIKSKMDALQNYQVKSSVVNTRLPNTDVITLVTRDQKMVCNYIIFREGSIVISHSFQVHSKLDETPTEIMSAALAEMREQFQSDTPEVVVSEELELWDENLQQIIPKAGDRKRLQELSEKNALALLDEMKRRQVLHLGNDGVQKEVLLQVQEDLQLMELPEHIECFDNSNFQGAYPVAAMVVFKNGLPDKKNYRHYNIKTVAGINDFASMAEVVLRRYKRLLEENAPLPQLVIIDGGKGQLSAALESIETLGLTGKMALVGLAKREESLFFPGDKEPLNLPFDRASHKLIRFIRDEVHRFGISFHRQKRSQGTFKNELESIPGIGEKTATQLLQRFKSITKIKILTERELTGEIGASKAKIVFDYFHKP